MIWLFAWGGQSIGVSASTSILPMNNQDWFSLGWTAWISLQSKGLSRVFSNITVQKHQFFSAQLSSQSNSHIHTWLWQHLKTLLDLSYLPISDAQQNLDAGGEPHLSGLCSLFCFIEEGDIEVWSPKGGSWDRTTLDLSTVAHPLCVSLRNK